VECGFGFCKGLCYFDAPCKGVILSLDLTDGHAFHRTVTQSTS
jgi:hypothetical protein